MYPSSSIKMKITIATLLASAGDVEAHGFVAGFYVDEPATRQQMVTDYVNTREWNVYVGIKF
jgi:hypothetical protein